MNRYMRILFFVMIWLCITEDAKAATPPLRALPPSVGPLLQNTWEQLKPHVVADNISINKDIVTLNVCLTKQPNLCHQVAMTDPFPLCKGEKAGPWCVSFSHPPPPSEIKNIIIKELQEHQEHEVWIQVRIPQNKEHQNTTEPDIPLEEYLLKDR